MVMKQLSVQQNKENSSAKSMSAYVRMMRASDVINSYISQTWREAGLTISQFGVLEVLYHKGPLCQSDIANKILKTTGNITMVIENLSRKHYIKRVRDPHDRRYYIVHLTEKGRALIEEIFPAHVERIHACFSSLNASALHEFAEHCLAIGRNAPNSDESSVLSSGKKRP
jgi:MarR family 2-MHQ and catechol resistance regulon transcriptional repressor